MLKFPSSKKPKSSTSSNNNNNSKKMPAKAPIYLKNGYKDGKKLREILSTSMISPPMGDVRHTAHVGRGADDVFGDTKFMEKELGAAAGVSGDGSSSSSGGMINSTGMMGSTGVMGSTGSSEPSLTNEDVTAGINATLRRNGNHPSNTTNKKMRHLSSNQPPMTSSTTSSSSSSESPLHQQVGDVTTTTTSQPSDVINILDGWMGVDLGSFDDVINIIDHKLQRL